MATDPNRLHQPTVTNPPAKPRASASAARPDWRARLRRWVAWPQGWEPEEWCGAALAPVFVVLAVACLAGRVHLYLGDIGDGANRLYLYSTIAEVLATILALLVTATLVATQLAAQTFTPRVVGYRMRDPWLWLSVAVFGLGILAALAGLASSGRPCLHAAWQQRLADFAVLLAGVALVYMVPFTLAVLRSLEPRSFIAWLLKKREYEGLEDFMRKAINEGLVHQLRLAAESLRDHAEQDLGDRNGDPDRARVFAALGTSLARYAAAKKDQESIIVAMQFLTAVCTSCTHRVYRAAADVFNEAVIQLQIIAEEAFGS